jgi:SAM-dependent methyltransferase
MTRIDYDPATYWNKRFHTVGHTGWSDEAVYLYDQPLRLKAIDKALNRAGIYVQRGARCLDLGCGTGDLVMELAEKGASVTAIDISSEAVQYVKSRFFDYENVQALSISIEEADFESDSFDLITSVTVLQHVTNLEQFTRAVENIVRTTRKKGHVLILETSPISVKRPSCSSYQVIRTRREWIEAFENRGCMLIYEMGLPQFGIRFLRLLDKILHVFERRASSLPFSTGWTFQRNKNVAGRHNVVREMRVMKGWKLVGDLSRRVVLKLAWPLDRLLIPFPLGFTTLRILVFEKK